MNIARLRADILAGLTSSFALVPECIAFALVAHLNPLMGLYGAFIICTLTALLGGRPGMVSGAAGSMAVDLVVVRPLGAVATVLGVGLFVLNLPLSVIQGEPPSAPAQRWIVEPAAYTFSRPLGQME